MKSAILLHGIGGSPQGNWFPWFQQELHEKGFDVFVPQMPNSSEPTLREWLVFFDAEFPALTEDVHLVGHSLGATCILRILEKTQKTVGSVTLVAAPVEKMGNDFDARIASFIDHPYDWSAIKKNAKAFYVIYSDDDPYVPLRQGEELASQLGTQLKVINKGGHLNQGSGYTEFSALLPYFS